jgi:hypothetical protein
MTVVDLDGTAVLLRAKRQELQHQLDAIDTALAALTAGGLIVANTEEQPATELAKEATGLVVPTRVKPRRVLSDEHRHALTEGRRKARHARDSAAGHAREAPDPSPGLAVASGIAELPRLVKRGIPGSRRE